MSDWKILPDGNLINLDEVEFIKVEKNIIFLKTSTHTYTVELDDEWREILKELTAGGE